jgi:hypothetical protein
MLRYLLSLLTDECRLGYAFEASGDTVAGHAWLLLLAAGGTLLTILKLVAAVAVLALLLILLLPVLGGIAAMIRRLTGRQDRSRR